jgi:hypothetical protein
MAATKAGIALDHLPDAVRDLVVKLDLEPHPEADGCLGFCALARIDLRAVLT